MAQSPIPNPASPRISIIVAYAANRVIGSCGKMPWHLSEDLKRFRQITTGHSIVMGRKTWESIGRLLPGRRHVIISRRPGYAVPGATVVASLGDAIAACADESDVFVVGGGEIYRLALPLSDRIFATKSTTASRGTPFFPCWTWPCGRKPDAKLRRDENTSMRYSFVTLERELPRQVVAFVPAAAMRLRKIQIDLQLFQAGLGKRGRATPLGVDLVAWLTWSA